MNKGNGNTDESVKEYATEKRRSLSGHPKVEELADYHRGQLSAKAQGPIRDHLALCEECARLVLDMAGFSDLEPPSEEYRLTAEDVAAQKEALKLRLRGQEDAPPATVLEFWRRPADPAPHGRAGIPVWYHTASAALLTATAGLGLWVAVLKGPEPTPINLEVRNLFPLSTGVRGSSGAEEAVSMEATRDLVLLLEVLDPGAFPDYNLQIFDADGRSLWQGRGFERSEDGSFSLVFPRELRKTGSYRLRLQGLGDAAPKPLAEYLLLFETE